MMRALLGPVVLLLATALLAAGAAAAPTPRLDGAAARNTPVSVSPAPDDLALIELRFRGAGHRQLNDHTLRLGVGGPFGDDYLAGAVALAGSRGGARLLVLIVNRPSPLEDPASVRLLVRSRRTLGVPQVERLSDPFSDPRLGGTAICSLRLSGRLAAGALRALQTRGRALSGFTPAEAVADAYDVACGLPYGSAFKELVTASPSAPSPPAPSPPTPRPPGCTPCPPEPGIACPLALAPDICTAPLAEASRPAAAGAH